MEKETTVKGNCAEKIYAILMNSTEQQAVFMTAVLATYIDGNISELL